jgi:DNA-directed RNA polymerases I and III subunit RPAC2
MASSVPLFKPTQEGDSDSGVIHYTDEDHTLGNTLRYYLLRDSSVYIAGYRITHPLKNEMTVSISTDGTKTVPEVVNLVLDRLAMTCDDLQSQLDKQISK